jgi:hypothetical protein
MAPSGFLGIGTGCCGTVSLARIVESCRNTARDARESGDAIAPTDRHHNSSAETVVATSLLAQD